MSVVFWISLLLFTVACEPTNDITMTMEASTSISFVKVHSTPEFPYQEADPKEAAESCMTLVATHLPTGQKFEKVVRLLRDQARRWEKNPLLAGMMKGEARYYGDTAGVEVSISQSEERSGEKPRNDRMSITIPFGENRKGTTGNYRYEAIWTKKPDRVSGANH